MMRSPGPPLDRRSFLGTLGVAAGTATLHPMILAAERPRAIARHRPDGREWDLSWLEQLDRARHKQVFDMGSLDWGLHVSTNYLNAFRDVMSLQYPDVVAVVGIASRAFPINASDALWKKYALGEKWDITDPATGKPAIRNVFAAEPAPEGYRAEDAIPQVVPRGTIFWQCHNSLMGLSEGFAHAAGVTTEAMYAELSAGLLPHVKIVPAHTMAIGLVQEHGASYEKL